VGAPIFNGDACIFTVALVAGVVFLVLFLLPPLLMEHLSRKAKQQEESRGFEVKLNTGEVPVTEKKDENHG
jgi:hypothetical protein